MTISISQQRTQRDSRNDRFFKGAVTIAGLFVLISGGMILWQTSAIVNGGERNYISATVTLYVMIYNLFTTLLHLVGLGGGVVLVLP